MNKETSAAALIKSGTCRILFMAKSLLKFQWTATTNELRQKYSILEELASGIRHLNMSNLAKHE
jgi:hypothetical protein